MKPDLTPRHVMGVVFATLNSDLAAYTLLTLVMVGIPTVLTDITETQTARALTALLSGLLRVLLTTMLTHSVMARLSGTPAGLQTSLAAALRFWPLAFAVQLVSGLATLAGLVLLVVPGVILAIRWLLPVPAILAEEIGLGPSLRRSTELTNGHRWPLLGLLVGWLMLFLVLPTVLVGGLADGGAEAWQVVGTDMLFDMVGAATGAAGLAVIYHELRGPVRRSPFAVAGTAVD